MKFLILALLSSSIVFASENVRFLVTKSFKDRELSAKERVEVPEGVVLEKIHLNGKVNNYKVVDGSSNLIGKIFHIDNRKLVNNTNPVFAPLILMPELAVAEIEKSTSGAFADSCIAKEKEPVMTTIVVEDKPVEVKAEGAKSTLEKLCSLEYSGAALVKSHHGLGGVSYSDADLDMDKHSLSMSDTKGNVQSYQNVDKKIVTCMEKMNLQSNSKRYFEEGRIIITLDDEAKGQFEHMIITPKAGVDSVKIIRENREQRNARENDWILKGLPQFPAQ